MMHSDESLLFADWILAGHTLRPNPITGDIFVQVSTINPWELELVP